MGYAGISILRTIDQMASEICGVQNGLKLLCKQKDEKQLILFTWPKNILVKKFLGRKFILRFAKYLIKFPD